MADLSDLTSSQTVKVVGANSTGVEQTPVQSTSSGGLHSNLRNSAGVEAGLLATPITTTLMNEHATPFTYYKKVSLAAGVLTNYTSTLAQKTVINRFRFGGRVLGEASFSKYTAATTLSAGAGTGGFNSIANVAAWTDTSLGTTLLTPAWAYTTAQFNEGTGSAIKTFTASASNDYPEITYTYSTPIDVTMWRYISAQVRATVATGGAQARTVSIRLTSGTAVRVYSIVGSTTTPPFSTEQWQTILGEIEVPSSTSGSGTFDPSSVNSISLRLQDGGNKAGSVYWDDVKFIGAIEAIDKIYSKDTRELTFDPAVVFQTGETILLSLRNNDSTPGEMSANVTGVKP